jgi:hypothetical protein
MSFKINFSLQAGMEEKWGAEFLVKSQGRI